MSNSKNLNLKLNPKYFYSLGIVLLIIGIIKLFSFSTFEDSDSYQQSFNKNYKIFSLNIPSDLNFAGEKVPIENFDTRERFDRELLINTYWQSQTLLFFKRANRWFPVIEPILKKHNIPDDFKYLALTESGLANVVSSAGATGYWQILESTANENGLEVNSEIDERYNMEKSTKAACKYLKAAFKKFNSWTLAAAAYNMGITGIEKQLERQKVNNYYDLLLNEETSRYVFRTLAIKEVLSHPDKYGFYFRKKDLYPSIPTYQVEIDSSITNFADFAIQHGINYKTLKIFNPWLRQNYLTNKDSNTYYIKIPNEGYVHLFQNAPSIPEEEQIKIDSLNPPSPNIPLDSLNINQKDSIKVEEMIED